MLDNEAISEVLFRMTGEIHPIQETNYDNKAFDNQEKIMFVVDRCIDEIMQNAERDDTYAYSVARSSDRAKEYLLGLVAHIHRHLGKNIIKDFATYYLIAKNKIELNLWPIEYAKGFLFCFLDYVLDVSEDNYNEYAKLIDDLE